MSQKTDTMIKLALVFFVSLLSFSIGTYVGKKYSDNQHKLSLLEPKKETSSPKTDEFASDASEIDKNHGLIEGEIASNEQKPVALTDSEVAKIAEEFAAEDTATEEKLVATIDAQEKELKTITETPKIAPAVKNIEAASPGSQVAVQKTNAKPIAARTEERTPASIEPKKEVAPMLTATASTRSAASIALKKEVAPMHFTVQIGSFPTQAEAEKMTKELQAKGYKTTFVPANINGQMWFRVNVGLFGTIKEAQDYKKEFLEKTKLASAIVQRVL